MFSVSSSGEYFQTTTQDNLKTLNPTFVSNQLDRLSIIFKQFNNILPCRICVGLHALYTFKTLVSFAFKYIVFGALKMHQFSVQRKHR
jgi:hypothetical protein